MLQILAERAAKASDTDDAVFMLSVTDPSLRYRVLSYNKATKRAVLKGKEGNFEMGQFTIAKLQSLGYKLVFERDLPPMPAVRPVNCTKKCMKATRPLCSHDEWVTCSRRSLTWTVH